MIADWIAIDWGTSNLRLWAMDHQDHVLDEKTSSQGMGGLKPEEFEAVLLSHVESWLGDGTTPVLACGMVGARQGWVEAPYAQVPTKPLSNWVQAPCEDKRMDVRILSGLSQDHPADVMRGEETQIAGFLAEQPDFDGVICLPGTHSKWVEIKNGQVQRFQTAMTGEFFALLSEQSVLRHSLGEWDDAAFEETIKAPEHFPLFSIRAGALLHNDQQGIARLSAYLIRNELTAHQDYWEDNPVVVIGQGQLVKHYAQALSLLGKDADRHDGKTISLAGLKRAKAEIFT